MKLRAMPTTLSAIALAVGLTAILPPPAEAARARKHKQPAAVSMKHSATAQARHWGASAVPTGPLYHGPEYLGDDPDPNIRSYMMRDLSTRYGGGNN